MGGLYKAKMTHHKTLSQIRKAMNKIDKNLTAVNDTFTELQGLLDKHEEEHEKENEQ